MVSKISSKENAACVIDYPSVKLDYSQEHEYASNLSNGTIAYLKLARRGANINTFLDD